MPSQHSKFFIDPHLVYIHHSIQRQYKLLLVYSLFNRYCGLLYALSREVITQGAKHSQIGFSHILLSRKVLPQQVPFRDLMFFKHFYSSSSFIFDTKWQEKVILSLLFHWARFSLDINHFGLVMLITILMLIFAIW